MERVEDFPGTILIEPMKIYRGCKMQKQENKAEKKRLETKQTGLEIYLFNEQKNIKKIEKENQGFRSSKNCTSNCSRTKSSDNAFQKKAKELENINNKIEDREERCLFSAKIEG
jgi:ATP-binding cassette subfamily F protein uup